MNDPNGLCFFHDEYHLFYQYNPYDTEWAKMHWGHATSKDLVHWTHLPIALTPDAWYEDDPQGGCFSGSAIVVEDVLYLIYTATQGGRQRQCVALSKDGVHFEKYVGNPVLETFGYDDFRDPKVFEFQGSFYLVVGMRGADNVGHVLLYQSPDLFSWSYVGNLYTVPPEVGTMPECPDFFQLGDSWVLTFSPMDYGIQGAPVTAVVGSMDFSTYTFIPHTVHPVDFGPDYYAAQSFLTPTGDRIGFAWANEWPWMRFFRDFGPTEAEGWRGFLTLPRGYRLEQGRLCSYPVKTMETEFVPDYSLSELVLDGLNGTRYYLSDFPSDELFIHLDFGTDQTEASGLEIGLFSDDEKTAILFCDFLSRTMTFIETGRDGSCIRFFPADLPSSGNLSIDVFLDAASTEIYVNQGVVSLTVNLYREDGFIGPWICSKGKKFVVNTFISGKLNDAEV